MPALAEAFVAVRADTSKVRGDISAGFAGAGSVAESHGRAAGARFAIAAGAAVAAGAVAFAGESIKAYTEAQTAQDRLSNAFERFPKLADVSKDALTGLNTELQKKTRLDDDALATGQATLAQFGLTGQQIRQLTPLLGDYAVKTGQDVPAAAEQLGKAMLGQGRALKNVGINFKDTHTVAGNFNEVMSGLRTNVGGFAEAEGKTAAGQAQILRNQFGELQETVGSKLLPALQRLTAAGLKVVEWIQNNADVVGPLTAAVLALAAAGGIYTAVQWAMNAALLAFPLTWIIIGLVALGAGLVIAYKKSETFRNIVNAAWNGIRTAVGAVVGWFQNWVFPTLSNVFRWVSDRGSWLADQIRGVGNGIQNAWNRVGQAFIAVKNSIGSAWDQLRELAAKPIRFVVNTVFGGVVDAFNKVSGAVGGPQLTRPSVGFAAGGYTGNGGTHEPVGVVHGGEYVINQRSTSKIMAADPRLLPSLNGYADGGLVGWLKSAGSAVASGASHLVDFIKDPGSALSGVLDSLLGGIGGTTLGQLGIGVARKLVSAITDKAKSFVFGGGGSVAGISQSVQRWAPTAAAAMAAAGLPSQFLPLLLQRMNVESGGNSAAINLWDSNAAAGMPSQGLMQTIPPTFYAYAGPYASRGILDPFANIYAAIKYSMARYGLGGIPGAWGGTHGYDTGGWLMPGASLAVNGTGRPERVIGPADQIRLHPDDVAALSRPVYVQNPFTGEYLLAQVADAAGKAIGASVNELRRGRR